MPGLVPGMFVSAARIAHDRGCRWGGDKMGNFDGYVEGVVGEPK
jgi:hypothetical protein